MTKRSNEMILILFLWHNNINYFNLSENRVEQLLSGLNQTSTFHKLDENLAHDLVYSSEIVSSSNFILNPTSVSAISSQLYVEKEILAQK